MRTALSVAALAAGALAVPHKRDVVFTDYDIVYVTDVVTVTAGQAPPAYTPASSSSEAPAAQHYGHHNGWHHPSVWTSAWETTWTEVVSQPASTSTPVAPAYTPPPSSTPEPYTPPPSSTPEPEPETTSTPVYNIPLTTFLPSPSSVYVAPKSSAAPSSGGSYGGVSATYGKAVIDSHNLHRSNHSAPEIEWDDDLLQSAMALAKTCLYGHDTDINGGGYGQNIAAGVDSDNIVGVITDMFYNGEEALFAADGCYGQANPDMTNFEGWGHFTQVVWKDTTHVACYTTTASDCARGIRSPDPADPKNFEAGKDMGDMGPYFTVCNYKNPGNYAGEYADNVGRPLGQPISYAASS